MRPPAALTLHVRSFLLALCACLTGSCDNGIVPSAHEELPTLVGAIASDPASVLEGEQRVVTYISTPPGTTPTGIAVVIRNPATGASRQVTLTDGGFDPVAIEASDNDTLRVEISQDSGQAMYKTIVPARRRPVVVRTNPTKGKRDVPLNLVLSVVFSEPINPASITSSSVRLRRNGNDVPAQLHLDEQERLVLSIASSTSLEPLTGYVLSISTDVRDTDGDALESPVELDFTTADYVPGGDLARIAVSVTTTSVPSSETDPDGYDVFVDGQHRGTVFTQGSRLVTVTPGDHIVVISGIAVPCGELSQNPDTVTVAAGQTRMVNVAIGCGAGFVRVRTTTTGDAAFPSYSVYANGWYWIPNRPVSPNGEVVVRDRPGLGRAISIHGAPEHCQSLDDTLRTVTLVPGDTIPASFAFFCAQRSDVRIAARATGPDPDTSGYTVFLRRAGFAERIVEVPPSDPVVVSALVNGEWQMTISGVAPNCDVVGENPRVVNVSADGILDMPFDIACQTPTEIAYAGVCGGNDLDICVARSNGGSIRRVSSLPGDEGAPKWSPDGARIAFVARSGSNIDIHVVAADGSGLTRLTTHDAADYDPAWSPDGSKIVFVSERDGNAELYIMNANGSDIARLTNNPGVDEAPSWSPDGTRIAYRSEHVSFGPGNGEIVSIRPDGTDMQRLTADGANDNAPAWSPDGSKIAFARFMSCYDNGDDTTMCQSDIFTMDRDGGGVTRVGGIRRPFYWPNFYYEDDEQRPSWSPDGRKIAFEMTSCASDGHCHTWTGIGVITVGAPGFTDFTAPAYAPSWRRN